MKQTALRYAIYSVLLMLALSMVHFFIVLKNVGYNTLEASGYLTMLLSMIFVFFGIRHYRNEKNNGVLSFGQGLKLGLLIILIPSVFFGLFDVFYAKVINPNWVEDCYDSMRRSMTPAEFEVKRKEFESQLELYSNPFFQFLIMFGTVFIIGFIVTIISALSLQRKRPVSNKVMST